MSWNEKSAKSIKELEELLEDGKVDEALALVYEFEEFMLEYGEIGHPAVARRVLRLLRNYALFDDLLRVGRCIKDREPDNPVARKLYCHALIEGGELTLAIKELNALHCAITETVDRLNDSEELSNALIREDAEEQLPETLGLLGRAYKQLYVNADPNEIEPRTHDLKKSIDYYKPVFYQRPRANHWHGVNFIALATRHERVLSGSPRKTSFEASQAAQLILDTFAEKVAGGGKLDYWEKASRAEALIALGQNKAAIEAVREYLDAASDRFMVQSTLRQFREVWNLTEEMPPGRQILPMITAKLAQLPGAHVEVDPNFNFEAVLGDTKYQPIEWLIDAMARSKAVARLGRDITTGSGTGFLFDGAWLGPRYAADDLLLTNAHVCTSDENVRKRLWQIDVLSPKDAVVGFLGRRNGAASPEPIKVVEELFTSPPNELDATLLRLESAPTDIKCPPLGDPRQINADDRVSIIGHPHGKRLSVSLQDNKVVDTNETYLHYKTPTDPGSSGSPIFNQHWELVGLHHASKPGKNEGIRIDAILEAITSKIV